MSITWVRLAVDDAQGIVGVATLKGQAKKRLKVGGKVLSVLRGSVQLEVNGREEELQKHFEEVFEESFGHRYLTKAERDLPNWSSLLLQSTIDVLQSVVSKSLPRWQELRRRIPTLPVSPTPGVLRGWYSQILAACAPQPLSVREWAR